MTNHQSTFQVYLGIGPTDVNAVLAIERGKIRVEPKTSGWMQSNFEPLRSDRAKVAFRTTRIAVPWANSYIMFTDLGGTPRAVTIRSRDRERVLSDLVEAGFEVEQRRNWFKINLPPDIRVQRR